MGADDGYPYRLMRTALLQPRWRSRRSRAHVKAFHAAEIIYVFDDLGKSPYPYANRAYRRNGSQIVEHDGVGPGEFRDEGESERRRSDGVAGCKSATGG